MPDPATEAELARIARTRDLLCRLLYVATAVWVVAMGVTTFFAAALQTYVNVVGLASLGLLVCQINRRSAYLDGFRTGWYSRSLRHLHEDVRGVRLRDRTR